MHSSIFQNKKKLSVGGVVITDLFTKSVDYSLYKQGQIVVIANIMITDIFDMRPDVISYFFYKNPNYWDIILKFNGISNPFSLQKGDIIQIPELTSYLQILTEPLAASELNINKNNL